VQQEAASTTVKNIKITTENNTRFNTDNDAIVVTEPHVSMNAA
jgi:hypothetical protein